MKKSIYTYSLLSFFVFCTGALKMQGQQILNLDFEKKSIEGVARPWGWDLVNYAETKVVLDSLVTHHGRFSLKMEASSVTDGQSLAYMLEPYELRNKTVKIEGWIKATSMKGSANFSLNYFIASDTAGKEIKTTAVDKSTDWVKFILTANIPVNANSLTINIQLQGAGMVWFDDLALFVNGVRKQQVNVTSSFTGKQIEWLGNHSYPLQGVDASPAGAQPKDDDLGSFKSIAADARIIALGESTHGTSEFFRLKHRVLDYCVRQLGVRIFAIEDHPLIVARANKYIMSGTGNGRSSMYGMLGVWQTKEVHDMIEWMRAYNDLHPADKVEFAGFDIQNHSLTIDSLYSFIAKRSPEMAQPVHELLDHLSQNGQHSYSVTDSVKLAWFDNASKALQMISARSAGWLLAAGNRQDSLSIYAGIQYATLVKQFAENTYRGHASLYRDIAMAENVSWLIMCTGRGLRPCFGRMMYT